MTLRSHVGVCLATLTAFTGCGVFTAGRSPVQTSSMLLRVNPANPRYFTDGSGKTVYLAGNIGTNFQDTIWPTDYNQFLNDMVSDHQNAFRLWVWEHTRTNQSAGMGSPMPYQRTGPGIALDGLPKFDLNKFDQSFFDRLRSAVAAAGSKGIYVGVMLFQGWSVNNTGSDNPFFGHYFNAQNNINGINGDVNGDGYAYEVHSLANSAVTSKQDAYVRKVIDTLNDLDNVYWEISNESPPGATAWQYHMIDLIHSYEAGKPKQHLVQMSATGWDNSVLFSSPAEIVSPTTAQFDLTTDPYASDPPPVGEGKTLILDGDHVGWKMFKADGLLGERWVWKAFTRGYNIMDVIAPASTAEYYTGGLNDTEIANLKMMTGAVDQTRVYADKMNLIAMTPRGDLTSTGYALANPGWEYLVFAPGGGTFTVNLSGVSGFFLVEWANPVTGATTAGSSISGDAQRSLSAPFSGDAALYLKNSGSAYSYQTPTTD